MEEEKERKEYVMNETGRIWMGTAKNYDGLPWVFGQVCFVKKRKEKQGGHGTGKTGNLVLTFSRQGKHREFCSDTGKNLLTQGKYLDCDY